MLTVVKKMVTDSLQPSDVTEERIEHITKTRKTTSGSGWLLLDLITLLYKIVIIILESFLNFIILPYEKSLFNEIVLVTGAGHGIGRALAVKFSSEGAIVICLDKDDESNKETHDLLKSGGNEKVYHYKVDVSSREDMLSVAERIKREIGIVTILVNNAGIMPCHPLEAQSDHDINRTFQVNILSHFWALEAFLPEMKRINRGHIVAISSMCGINAIPNLIPYCASKFAVTGLMEGLYEELRSEKPRRKIYLTSVYPYMVDTGLVKKPKSRFPEILKLISTDEVADQVIRAVKTNQREVSVPGSFLTSALILRLLPYKMVELVKDFLDTGVDPDD